MNRPRRDFSAKGDKVAGSTRVIRTVITPLAGRPFGGESHAHTQKRLLIRRRNLHLMKFSSDIWFMFAVSCSPA